MQGRASGGMAGAPLRIIGTKYGPNGGAEGDGLIGDASHLSATSRLRVDMPSYDVVLKSVAYWNGYIKYNGAAEADGPNSITVKAAFELAGAGSTIPLYANGQRSVAIAAGARQLFIPSTRVVIPGGSLPYARQYVLLGATGQWPVNRVAHGTANADLGNSDNTFGTGAGSDQCDAVGTFGNNAAVYAFGPCGIYGIPADGRRRKQVAIFGDSIATYSGADLGPSYGDTNGYPGFIERATRNQIATIAATRASGRLQWVAAGFANQLALIGPYVTHAIIELGRNDITNGRVLAELQADFATLANALKSFNVKVWATTITPKPTGSANSWVDGGNATNSTQDAVRASYNTWLKTLPLGIAGCFDVAATVEDSGRPGYWTPNATALTTDGTHLSAAGMTLASAAIDISKF
jgi:lysophospholipase L1-like esterase